MNPMYDDSEHVQIKVYTSNQEKYHAETSLTPEMIDAMGKEQIGSESLRILLDILNKAYDEEFYWQNGDIHSNYNQQAWEKIKNINTDEELEEIKHLLGIRHEN